MWIVLWPSHGPFHPFVSQVGVVFTLSSVGVGIHCLPLYFMVILNLWFRKYVYYLRTAQTWGFASPVVKYLFSTKPLFNDWRPHLFFQQIPNISSLILKMYGVLNVYLYLDRSHSSRFTIVQQPNFFVSMFFFLKFPANTAKNWLQGIMLSSHDQTWSGHRIHLQCIHKCQTVCLSVYTSGR